MVSGHGIGALGELVAPGVVTETFKGVTAVPAGPLAVGEGCGEPDGCPAFSGGEGLECDDALAAAAEDSADGLQQRQVFGEKFLEVRFEEQIHQRVVECGGLGKHSTDHKGKNRDLAGISEGCPHGNDGIRGPGSQESSAYSNA